MTPAEKAHMTRYFKAARSIVRRIEALLAIEHKLGDVVRVFETVKAEHRLSKAVIADAFCLLDNEPHRFGPDQHWHARLRQVRNSPEAGPKLFAIWG
jgi:hypothetical protein